MKKSNYKIWLFLLLMISQNLIVFGIDGSNSKDNKYSLSNKEKCNVTREKIEYIPSLPAEFPAVASEGIDLWTQDGTTIYLEKSGNVGIGTMSPDTKLTVNGKIHAKELIIDLNVPGPDYVFSKEYNLMPLYELEKYIKQNKHLPEIPSAKEIEANQINLLNMNMLILKKVEELTLYVIEHEKRINQLENKY